MKNINLCFLDFWNGFNENDNFFTRYFKSLLNNYSIKITKEKDADLVIYSIFGNKHLNIDRTKTKKLFFTGENVPPDLKNSDFCFSFDTNNYDEKNIRMPLWYHYIDWFEKGSYEGEPEQYLIHPSDFNKKWFKIPKTKNCCSVFSNPVPERFKMVEALSKYLDVNLYGKLFENNIGNGIIDKYKIISNYKVNICFENSIGPGYVTEKLLHARTAGNLALYYGTEDVSKDFNKNGFIHVNNFFSFEECAKHVQTILSDEKKYNQIINEPIFNCNFFEFNYKVKNILTNL